MTYSNRKGRKTGKTGICIRQKQTWREGRKQKQRKTKIVIDGGGLWRPKCRRE